MNEYSTQQSWWHTTPGLLAAIAGLITAITVLITALDKLSHNEPSNQETQQVFKAAEAKILQDIIIQISDIQGLTKDDLRKLRNVVFARHGRIFDSQDLRSYFNSCSWYSPRADFKDEDLTVTDRANIQLIISVEKSN